MLQATSNTAIEITWDGIKHERETQKQIRNKFEQLEEKAKKKKRWQYLRFDVKTTKIEVDAIATDNDSFRASATYILRRSEKN